MTEHDHTDDQPRTPQTIVLDDPEHAAVFVAATEDRPVRVFYDLEALVNVFTAPVVQERIIAEMTNDDHKRAMVQGASSLLLAVLGSKDDLTAEYNGHEVLSGEGTTIADMFPDA